MDKFVLKIWITKKVSFFVGIISGVRDVLLPSCTQVFSLLNLKFRSISKPDKSPIQRKKSSYK